MSTVELESLTRSFGSLIAVDHLSLAVECVRVRREVEVFTHYNAYQKRAEDD